MSAQKYGILPNTVDDAILDQWREIYQKTTITKTADNDNCWGIDKKCHAYNWFLKKVMPIIGKTFNEGAKLIFSSFIDLHTPLKIHTDLKTLPEGESGEHYISILIPYSIDYQKENFNNASTCFYNEDKTLIDTIPWQRNSLIWWDSSLLHNSGGFLQHNIKSKQYFITHTYV
jgi:hypothetical protein